MMHFVLPESVLLVYSFYSFKELKLLFTIMLYIIDMLYLNFFNFLFCGDLLKFFSFSLNVSLELFDDLILIPQD